ncbi:aminopeptidase [Candidatus Pacearchaeota archaeon CG10_big_fil_rev_8_21_14_0_10_34_12]|nr:MAG: aminopeptidase [Candidatus Pacearchaeota archaeon CG10_big_fil_rev_8_21_14_0_10_34_12]
MVYTPSQEILEKYAEVLVNFALNDGKGIKKGEVVRLIVPEIAKPMLLALRRAVLKSGGNVITSFLPDEYDREFYELASEEQIKFFPEKFSRGIIEQIDHSVAIIAETNPKELEGIDSKKIMEKGKSFKPFMDWRNEKENRGKFTWTLGLYGTEQQAKEANLSLEEYWEQIINACFLNEENPVEKWKEIFNELERIKAKLNSMPIKTLHIQGEKIDLMVGIDKNRKWMAGSGRNIPSFEIFISPDWRKTNGKIRFNQPLYRYGNIIKDIELEFKDGLVVYSKARENEKVLKDMIATENANKIGEFSLTDSRMSRITKFMAETLYDENMGGEFGNTHIALGNAYQDSYPGNPSEVSKEKWEEMGYNNSSVHTDIISTEDRIVTATLEDNSEIKIYEKGKFLV